MVFIFSVIRSGVTSVIFRYGVHIFCHTKTNYFIDSVANPLQGETMGMQKLRIVSLSTKGVSKQDGIVEVPEETDCSGITSVNKKTSLSR
ncbi:hypothetical protein T08_15775 [Trichinella sp. T8]|nr:hypothetical protein T08_15775 [Trichinella sp. T8]